MKKGKKVSKTYRWAVVDWQGNVVRDVVGHRKAVYSTKVAAQLRNNYQSTPAGSFVKRVAV